MTILKKTSLYLEPAGGYVAAFLVPLSADTIEEQVHGRWWNDGSLKSVFDTKPIDQGWDWHGSTIEYEGRQLACEKIGIVAGDAGDVQGAMMISSDRVPSVLEPDMEALFVERLFTAPRNRRDLRQDGKNFLKAVGMELLTWGAWMSRNRELEGRLLLDASPDFVWWYEQKAHLQKLDRKPTLFEGVEYTPMELPVSGAQRLFTLWEDT